MERKHYLDNIRSFTVLSVMIYHCGYVFNGLGVLGGFADNEGFWLTDGFCTLIYPFFMVLLFCISGIAARHSIEKRGVKTFIKERVTKLIVPSTLGCLVLHWISGFINVKISGVLEFMPPFLIYPISVLSGTGPLWFAQLLFVYCLFSKLFVKLNNSKFDLMCKKTNCPALILISVLIWGSSQILNMPVVVVYRFGIYFISFLVGYFILYHEEVMDRVKKMLPVTLPMSIIMAIVYIFMYFGDNYTNDSVLKSPITNFYLWITILAIFGFSQRYMNKTNRVLKYLRENSFGLYVLHYLPIMIFGYMLNYHTSLSSGLCILFILVIDFTVTPVINFLLKKIPFIRYAVLGIKRGKNEI